MRIRKTLLAMAAAVAGSLWAGSAGAATLSIALQEAGVNGGAIHQVASITNADVNLNNLSFSGTYGDFAIKVLTGTADNTASLSDLLSATTKVTNNSSTSKTLHIYVSETDYTLPAGTPLIIESGLSGTMVSGTTGLVNIFQAYADKNNNTRGTSDYTNGPQTAIATGSTFDTGSKSGFFNRTGNYSLTSLVNLSLSGHGAVNFTDHIDATVAPLPATASTGMAMFLGLGTLVALRKLTTRRSMA